uniref:Polyprotein n=1 Tax=Cajanus cajan TaxID=3821 RepID=A0A151SM75_CAJCA|nr:hypothetical protein KK1_002084 [Cajanus cajan]
MTSLPLVNIRQDKKESLRVFMDRFNKAALEIWDLNPAVALHHLTTTLKPGPFVNSLYDPLVISVEIHNCIVKKMLVNQGSSTDILYWNTFKQLGISEKELVPYDDRLVGFSRERVSTRGYIKLFTRFCFDEQEYRKIQVKYIVVHADTSYNILLGRPSLNMLGAIVSTPHIEMKFPSDKGKILTIHADQKAARECYIASLRITPVKEKPSKSKRVHVVNPSTLDELPIWDLDPRRNDEEHVEPTEENIPLQISSHSSQVTYIGADALEGDRSALRDVIIQNKDLFAWTPSDMPGIDPNFVSQIVNMRRSTTGSST